MKYFLGRWIAACFIPFQHDFFRSQKISYGLSHVFESIKNPQFSKTFQCCQSKIRKLSIRKYCLSHNGHHGLEHWLRVLINGRLLAEANAQTWRLSNTLHLFMTSCVRMETWICIMVPKLQN